MSIYGKDITLLEAWKASKKHLTDILPVFYAHIVKYTSVNNTYRAEGSWIRSIKESIKQIKEEKKESHAAYLKYNIQDYIDAIHKEAYNIVKEENGNDPNLEKYRFQEAYQEFPTLDSIIEQGHYQAYLARYSTPESRRFR